MHLLVHIKGQLVNYFNDIKLLLDTFLKAKEIPVLKTFIKY